MKKWLWCLLPGFLWGCMEDGPDPSDPYIASSEIFTTEIGIDEVYGLRLWFYTPDGEARNLGYQVSFYQEDKVWIDTLYAEITPGDTLEGEVIFSGAKVSTPRNVNFKTQSFDVE